MLHDNKITAYFYDSIFHCRVYYIIRKSSLLVNLIKKKDHFYLTKIYIIQLPFNLTYEVIAK